MEGSGIQNEEKQSDEEETEDFLREDEVQEEIRN